MSLKYFLGNLFGTSHRLSNLERLILDSVRACIDERNSVLWDKQVQAINKIQRLPDGVEVDFYRMKGGRPTFNPELAFPNKTEELRLATLEIKLENAPQKLVANVWCVKGFLFSIEYEGSCSYFEEAAGADTPSELRIQCKLIAKLALQTNKKGVSPAM